MDIQVAGNMVNMQELKPHDLEQIAGGGYNPNVWWGLAFGTPGMAYVAGYHLGYLTNR